MPKNLKDDIQLTNFQTGYLGIDYKKLRIGIIGGGRVGFLKAKKFILNGSYVEVLSKNFSNDFFSHESEKVVLLDIEYQKSFILDKHLIIIAIDDADLRKKITDECNNTFKLFVECSNYKQGNVKIPYSEESNNFKFSISTKKANPKMCKLVGKKIKNLLKEYDKFEDYTYKIRCISKNIEYRDDLLNFVNTHEFKEIWEKGKADLVINLFFNELKLK